MTRHAARRAVPVLLVPALLALAGCGELLRSLSRSEQVRQSSSVVQFLYPDKQERVEPSIPTLTLPMTVGVAFVPETAGARRVGGGLTEKDKAELAERVGRQFREYPFVKSIEFIPPAYLRPGGSFTNLDQLRTMYGVDAIALLSYDQVQHTDEGLLSLTYWTLVGAYLFKGEKNDTSTLMDAAVYDIASRKLLFRAPGTSHVKGTSTPVNLSEQLRKDSITGFEQGADQLVANLKAELERFRARVKESPQEYVVAHRSGYSGGGSLGPADALLAVALAGAAWRWGRRGRRE
ncbi:MAG: rhombotarget lipoprotein [Deferrisomatales bacterium]